MTGRFGNAIDNFLIIMVAVAVVLLLVVMLGSRQSPFRQKLSRRTGTAAGRSASCRSRPQRPCQADQVSTGGQTVQRGQLSHLSGTVDRR